jgi:hypothetical protein
LKKVKLWAAEAVGGAEESGYLTHWGQLEQLVKLGAEAVGAAGTVGETGS